MRHAVSAGHGAETRGQESMKAVLKLLALTAMLAIAFGIGWVASAVGVGRAAAPDSLEERERQFVERMQNVVLVGHFTVAGSDTGNRHPERYEINSITKLDGNRWRFNTRMTYADVDLTLPVVVPIEWAGDTPMISITNFDIPGVGEDFSTRLVFYEDRYAGTWDHGKVGGLMFGEIEPLPESDESE